MYTLLASRYHGSMHHTYTHTHKPCTHKTQISTHVHVKVDLFDSIRHHIQFQMYMFYEFKETVILIPLIINSPIHKTIFNVYIKYFLKVQQNL